MRVGFFYFKVQARWPTHANTLSLTYFFLSFYFFLLFFSYFIFFINLILLHLVDLRLELMIVNFVKLS